MPYLSAADRSWMDIHQTPRRVGELNYALTQAVLDFLPENPRYEDFNAAVGALECAKLELYRRMVAEYEDEKCAENGDVYP